MRGLVELLLIGLMAPSAPLDRRRVDYDRRHKEARHPAIGWNKEE
jgi:hypothetical protein